VNLLSHDPDYALDPFYVAPDIVELFDSIKREKEEDLKPLREQKRKLAEQKRAEEEARRKLLSPEPRSRIVRVETHHYALNWMPFGGGQFQNGQDTKGTAIAIGELGLGIINLGTIVWGNQIATDHTRFCFSGPGCGSPPYNDNDRALVLTINRVTIGTAIAFWALYAYGVVDAHLNYQPKIEIETGGPAGGARASIGFSF
jgi:hypothetical protein